MMLYPEGDLYFRQGQEKARPGTIMDEGNTNPPRQNPSAEEVRKAEEALKESARLTHEVLVSATTVFPFTLFPDTITVDREKVTIVRRIFFGAATVRSIKLEDVLDITAGTGPIFGSLHIVSRGVNPEEGFSLKFMKREDALKVKRILQGCAILSAKEDVDLDAIETSELADMLERAGRNEAPDISQQ